MKYALALTGPTASGKTSLSLKIATELGCEIISCDSMQIYKGMDIGTAKATETERALVPHHLIDIISPTAAYSVERYRKDALACVDDITARGKIPLFVGGTGLYIDSVIRPAFNESPESSPAIVARLSQIAETEEGLDELYGRLCEIDPESAEKIHKNNVKRLIRAIEIFEMTGKPKSYFDAKTMAATPDIAVGMITLDFHNRENLYSRVNLRVDEMLAAGLLDEARRLFAENTELSATASQAIGYKELLPYLIGERTLGAATEEIKLSSRRYAKRQLTWFRHNSDAMRLYIDTENGVIKDNDVLELEILNMAKKLYNDIKSK